MNRLYETDRATYMCLEPFLKEMHEKHWVILWKQGGVADIVETFTTALNDGRRGLFKYGDGEAGLKLVTPHVHRVRELFQFRYKDRKTLMQLLDQWFDGLNEPDKGRYAGGLAWFKGLREQPWNLILRALGRKGLARDEKGLGEVAWHTSPDSEGGDDYSDRSSDSESDGESDSDFLPGSTRDSGSRSNVSTRLGGSIGPSI